MAQQWRGVRLEQVNTIDASEAEPDVDIIAVHGLDTKSPHTWIWRSKDRNKPAVNWLADSQMLPARVQRVRIFTCDWPADLFQDSDSTPWTVEEFARRLLAGIQSMRHALAADRQGKDRPILFIASCLGGVILMKALVMADNSQGDYISIRKATCGIVFLATPFRGTSFQDVAAWVEPMLKAWASFRHWSVTQLLNSVKGSTFELEELVRTFTRLCHDKDHPCQVHTFYEKVVTILESKFLPACLLPWFGHAKLLVDSSSANLDIVKEPLALDRRHVMMNKFSGPEDPDYDVVAGKIRVMLQKIREGRPLEQADAWIRKNHYTADKLKIDRLSGELLPMGQCYINLAIVEQVRQDAARSDNKRGPQPQSSPFSLLARQKVETPDETIQVELATMFNQREGRDGRAIQPSRIFIRGRAGVGKTTLCKKIVYEFYRGTWSEWTKIFDRVLWVPLRNLKLQERQQPGYNFEHLFTHEYFSLPTSRPDLARELSKALATKRNKTLFLLDGLDEVSQDLGGAGDMSRFLKELLKQPNVIITSRPSAKPPPDMNLELETIGFFPAQVNAYLDADPNMNPRAKQVRSFLEKHWLIQGLVRIPIQLDALCYTWDGFDPGTVPGTMTDIYKSIERRLWKKDAVRLDKISEGFAQSACPPEIERKVETEIALLECLAFNGMHSDVIEFMPAHQAKIVNKFPTSPLPLGETLARLSFLRTSDSSSKAENRSYHFIHLTFQEYFAARYFVRQWTAGNPLACVFLNSQRDVDTDPVKFLQKHKYTARYDILWRFVAGLLDAEGQRNLRFFQMIEEEPLDLLGPTHQQLVMHCLSEVSPDMRLRQCLENNLMQWLLFECAFQQPAHLASEMEFPEQTLRDALRQGSEDAKIRILQSLERRPTVPPSVNELAPSWLKDTKTSWELKRQVCIVLQSSRTDLTNNVLTAVVQRLDDEDWQVQKAALNVLQKQSSLSDEILTAVVQRVDDENYTIREAALNVLQKQSSLSDETLMVVVQRLGDEYWQVRRAACDILQERPSLSDEILTDAVKRLNHEHSKERQAALRVVQEWQGVHDGLSDEILTTVVQRLDDRDRSVQSAAIGVLQQRPSLSNKILMALVQRLYDKRRDVRRVAQRALRRQLGLPDEILTAVVQRLDNNNLDARKATLEILEKEPSLSNEILTAVVQQLDDEDSNVREAALGVLREQSSLSDAILTVVVQRLDNEDSHIRWLAMAALKKQSSLSNETLTAIVQRLNDEDLTIQEAALRVLQEQPSLSNEILMAVLQQLYNKDLTVRGITLKVLQKQSSLPNETLTAVVQQLDNKDWRGRWTALMVLQERSSLYNKTLMAVVQQLDDKHLGVQEAPLGLLQKQSSLSDRILMAILQRLNDKESIVRETALEILQKQSSLSDRILMAILQRLNDKESIVRESALEILQERSSLSNNLSNQILTAVAQQLEFKSAGGLAEEVLRKYEKFYSTLLSGPYVGSLFKVLLRRAFEENGVDGVRNTGIENMEEFMDMIKKARQPDTPPTAVG